MVKLTPWRVIHVPYFYNINKGISSYLPFILPKNL